MSTSPPPAARRVGDVGVEREPRGPSEIDDAGELRDGEAIELTTVPLHRMVDAALGDLHGVDGSATCAGGLSQGVDVQHGGRDEQTARITRL